MGQEMNGEAKKTENPPYILIGNYQVTLEDVWNAAHLTCQVKLSKDRKFLESIDNGAKVVQKLLEEGHVIYGVNTGYGSNCTLEIPKDLITYLPSHLVDYHCCGMGKYFGEIETRAILLARLVSLARGFSGVRVDLLKQLVTLIENDILPCIPQTGSVGASGDLTPLSYVAAALCGKRTVLYDSKIQSTESVFDQLGIAPLYLAPKEGLAIMNGTAVMTGLAAIAYHRASYISKLSCRITSLAVACLRGNLFHFDEKLFSVKPHPGQQRAAARIRSDLLISNTPSNYSKTGRIQDHYSIRCAPHVIGVLEDLLGVFRQLIETELNSANDNPIIDAETGREFHGGMFYGGHIAFAMDGMKILVANIADLLDRQLALLVDKNYNQGLPSNLSGASGPKALIDHGLKALQISCSAWTAEALKNTVAASIFSRSTECHNQDKVSMGTIAARDCLGILELTEQVAAGMLIGVRQGLQFRHKMEESFANDYLMSEEVVEFMQKLKEIIPFVEEGVTLEPILRNLMIIIQNQTLELY